MFSLTASDRFYLYPYPTDMRRKSNIEKDGFQKRKTQLQKQNNNIKQSSISIAISLVFLYLYIAKTNGLCPRTLLIKMNLYAN